MSAHKICFCGQDHMNCVVSPKTVGGAMSSSPPGKRRKDIESKWQSKRTK